jgi:hypothetical protein
MLYRGAAAEQEGASRELPLHAVAAFGYKGGASRRFPSGIPVVGCLPSSRKVVLA